MLWQLPAGRPAAAPGTGLQTCPSAQGTPAAPSPRGDAGALLEETEQCVFPTNASCFWQMNFMVTELEKHEKKSQTLFDGLVGLHCSQKYIF